MFTGIKEALLMCISTANMHDLAVKGIKYREILSPNSAIREIKKTNSFYKGWKIHNREVPSTHMLYHQFEQV